MPPVVADPQGATGEAEYVRGLYSAQLPVTKADVMSRCGF